MLWADTDPVISFRASGALMPDFDGLAATQPELWVPKTSSARSDLVVVHRGAVAPNDRRLLGPIILTSPARTLVDLAGVLDDEDLTAVVEDALHRGLTTPMSIRRCLDALGGKGRPGTARLRAILDDRGNQRPTCRVSKSGSGGPCAPRVSPPSPVPGAVRQHHVPTGSTARSRNGVLPSKASATSSIAAPATANASSGASPTSPPSTGAVLPVTWDDIRQVVERERPGRHRRRAGDATDLDFAGKPSISVPAANSERCFTTAPARTTQPAPITLWSHTIAPGSTTDPRRSDSRGSSRRVR